jgi:hypothetical protein
MNLYLGSFKMAKGQKPGIKSKALEKALDTAIAKEAEATVNASDVKRSGRLGCTQIEILGGLLFWARLTPSFGPSHRPSYKEDAH